jgi:hypothetical protein
MRNPEGSRSTTISVSTQIESSIESEGIFDTELSKKSPDHSELITFLINLGQGQDRVNFIAKMVKNNQSAMNNVFEFLSGRTIHNIDNAKKNLIDDFLNPNTGFKKPIRKVSSLSVGSSIGRIESEEKFIEELGRDSPNYTNLNFFLISLETGQVRVNFIAKMVEKNRYAMDNVFRSLVERGVTDSKYYDDVKILIDDFINPASNFNIVKDCKGVNHIFNATHHGKPELVKHILERDPDSVNIVSKRGGSLIHVAVSNRMSEVLKELLNCSNLNLYALRTRKDKNKVTTIVENVFDIADKLKLDKKNKIPEMLLEEHKRRFDSGDPDAIAFENTFKILLQSANPKYRLNPSATIENSTMSAEGHNGNLQQAIIENREGSSAHLDPSGSPIIPAVDLDAIAFEISRASDIEISRASDKTINADAEMASSIINPDAPQASFQLNAESPMVWDDHWHLQHHSANLQSLAPEEMASSIINPDAPQASFQLNGNPVMVWDDPWHLQHHSANLQSSDPETANMSMAGSGSENGISVFRPPFIPAVHETTSLTQIIDSINENHEVKDPQPISKTSSNSAFGSFRKRGLDNSEKEQSNKSAKTTPEDGQSTDNGGRITSTSASPISQKSPPKSDQPQR